VRGAPRPAVFLDRDGVVLPLRAYPSSAHQGEVPPENARALARLHGAGYRLVLVTNQSALSRGVLTWPELRRMHRILQKRLEAAGAPLAGIYVCPHHPDWTGPCACRKPAPGLILQACRELGLDPARSYLVGDRAEDLEAARRAGLQALLVRTGYGGQVAPGAGVIVVDDLPAAVAWILAHPRDPSG
jgi:D-glycero-D-manno-heptose 1,7-bisphosphate phosphatase